MRDPVRPRLTGKFMVFVVLLVAFVPRWARAGMSCEVGSAGSVCHPDGLPDSAEGCQTRSSGECRVMYFVDRAGGIPKHNILLEGHIYRLKRTTIDAGDQGVQELSTADQQTILAERFHVQPSEIRLESSLWTLSSEREADTLWGPNDVPWIHLKWKRDARGLQVSAQCEREAINRSIWTSVEPREVYYASWARTDGETSVFTVKYRSLDSRELELFSEGVGITEPVGIGRTHSRPN